MERRDRLNLQEVMLTRQQSFFMVFLASAGNFIYLLPFMIENTGRASYFSVLIGVSLLAFPGISIVLLTGKCSPKNIFISIEKGLGKITGRLIETLYIILNILLGAIVLNLFTGMIKVFILRTTPAWVILSIITISAFMISTGNIKSIGNMIQLFTFISIIIYFGSHALSLIGDFTLQNIQPVFGFSLSEIGKGIILNAALSSEGILLLFCIAGNIPSTSRHMKWVAGGFILWAVTDAVAIFVIIGIIGIELSKGAVFAGINAIKTVEIGNFIHGLEIFTIIAYQILAYAKMVVYLFCIRISSMNFLKSLKVQHKTAFAALAVFFIAIIIGSFNKAYNISVFVNTFLVLPFSLILIMLAAIACRINKKGER